MRARPRPAPTRCRRSTIATSTAPTRRTRTAYSSRRPPTGPPPLALEQTFDRVAAAQGRPAVRVTDVKPLPPKDPNGTAAFYAVIAWMFGGYIASTLIGLIGSPRSRSRQRAAARIGALAGFSIVAGILSVVLLRVCFDVFSGHVVALCAIAALTIFASGAATPGSRRRSGRPGRACDPRLRDPRQRRVGRPVRPAAAAGPLEDDRRRVAAGASVDLARSALFFDGARIAGPILVLVGWAVVGTALALALGGRITDPVDTEARPPREQRCEH